MCSLKSWIAALVLGGLFYSSPLMAGTIFTGPVSAYYLTDGINNTIYVVQGTSVVKTFPMAYGETEWPIAISGGSIRTTGYGSLLRGGQYTLDGKPTGDIFANVALGPVGDGTSDGVHNYFVQWTAAGFDAVYATDLNWRTPQKLFNLPDGAYEGITYDSNDNSLWISGYGANTLLNEYSLSGTLLSSLDTHVQGMSALSYDSLDHTLWFAGYDTNHLRQYSKGGTLLQEGVPAGLPNDPFYGGEQVAPEPGSLSLMGLGAVLICCSRLRRRAKQ